MLPVIICVGSSLVPDTDDAAIGLLCLTQMVRKGEALGGTGRCCADASVGGDDGADHDAGQG